MKMTKLIAFAAALLSVLVGFCSDVAFLDELAAAENCATLAVPAEFTDNFSVSGKAVYLTGIEEKNIRRVDCECHVLTKKSGILVGDVLSAIAEVKRLGGTTFNVSGQTMFKMHKGYKVPEDIEFPVNVNTDTSLYFCSQYCGDEEVVLDLNGHTLSQAVGIGGGYWYSRIHVDCATVRVIDSSEEKTGKVTGIGSCLTVTGYRNYTDDDYPEPTDLPGKLTIDAGLYTLTGGPTGSKTSGPYYAPNGLAAVFYAGELVINGGTFDAASELNPDGKCASVIGAGRSMNKPEWGMPSITINGGEFVAVPLDQLCDTRDPGVPQSEDGLFSGNATNADYVAINGGTFSVEPPKAMIAEGLEFKDGKVVAIEYTDGGDYTTNKKLSWSLSDIIKLAGQHIKYTCGEGAAYLDVPELDADGNLDGVVKLTLNNATITNSSDSNAIFLGTGYQAEIKLVGENTITAPSKTAIYLCDDTTITGDGSLAIREASTGIFGGTGSSLTIKSGTIDISSAYSAGKGISINYGVKYTQNGGTVNIDMTGGSAFGFFGSSASGTNPSSKFILNGGELTVIDAKRTAMNLSDAEINGGTLTAKHSQYASTAVVSASTRFVVTGGNIVVSKPDKNGNDVVSAANLSVTGAKISGGSFNFEPKATWIETGYQLKSLEDGSYGVAPKNTQAVIGTTEYDTLAEAFAAASVNQTIKLSKALTINEELTTVAAFDLNERTLTGGTISAKSITNGALIGTTIGDVTEILGGTFTDVTLGADVVVKGGTFNSDVSANCAAGLTAFPNGDETYSVLPIVAKIGETCFKSFEDAVESITDETMTTITLVADSSLKTVPYNITNKNLTLDLNGNALTHTEDGGQRMIYFTADNGNEHTIVVKDSSEAKTGRIEKIITNSISFGMAYTIVADKGSTLKLESGTLKSSGGGVWLDNAKFEMTGGRIDGGTSNGLMIQGGIAEKKVVESVISGGEITGKVGIKTGSYIDLLIKGDAVITGTVSNDDFGSIVAGYDNHIAITSGSVVVNGNIKGVAAREGQTDGSEIELSAGTYNNITNLEMLEGYILPGYLAWEVGENSYLVDTNHIAKVGETYFDNFESAIEAAGENGTIIIVGDPSRLTAPQNYKFVTGEGGIVTLVKKVYVAKIGEVGYESAADAVAAAWAAISTSDNKPQAALDNKIQMLKMPEERVSVPDDQAVLVCWKGVPEVEAMDVSNNHNAAYIASYYDTQSVTAIGYNSTHMTDLAGGLEVTWELLANTTKGNGVIYNGIPNSKYVVIHYIYKDVKFTRDWELPFYAGHSTIMSTFADLTIDLNGHTILQPTVRGTNPNSRRLLQVEAGTTTIKDSSVNGKLIGDQSTILVAKGGGSATPGHLILESGTIGHRGNKYVDPGKQSRSSVIVVQDGGTFTMNGGRLTWTEIDNRADSAINEYFNVYHGTVQINSGIIDVIPSERVYDYYGKDFTDFSNPSYPWEIINGLHTWMDKGSTVKYSKNVIFRTFYGANGKYYSDFDSAVKASLECEGAVTFFNGITVDDNGDAHGVYSWNQTVTIGSTDEFWAMTNYADYVGTVSCSDASKGVIERRQEVGAYKYKIYAVGEKIVVDGEHKESGETLEAPIVVESIFFDEKKDIIPELAEKETLSVEEKKQILETTEENGNKVWENYVLGIDSSKKLQADVGEGEAAGKLEVSIVNTAEVPANTGFTVEYVMDFVKPEATTATTLDTLKINLSDTSVDPTGIYQVKAIISSTDPDSNMKPVEIPTENKIGVIKATQEMELAIIAVPWKQIAAEDSDITVDNLVHKEMLDIGDMIYVYKTDGGYNSWTLEADANGNKVWGTMQVVDARGARTSGHAGDHTVQRGAGVFLKRQDPSKPYYLCGQVDDSEIVETLPEKINLVANPNMTDFNLNKEGAISAAEGDTIIVPTVAAPKKCTVNPKTGKWGYYKQVVNKPGIVSQVWVEEVSIPAGTGFWYEKGNKSSSSKINWTK